MLGQSFKDILDDVPVIDILSHSFTVASRTTVCTLEIFFNYHFIIFNEFQITYIRKCESHYECINIRYPVKSWNEVVDFSCLLDCVPLGS